MFELIEISIKYSIEQNLYGKYLNVELFNKMFFECSKNTFLFFK